MPVRQRSVRALQFGVAALLTTASGALIAIGALGLLGSGAGASGAQLVGYGHGQGDVTSASGVARAAVPDAVGVRWPGSFSIAGTVSGLFPGKTVPLELTVTNPQNSAITVIIISTSVSNASSQCLAANIKVTSFFGRLLVVAGGQRTATVGVSMAIAAPNACQNAQFEFSYIGRATLR
jgi:hypothetical protein